MKQKAFFIIFEELSLKQIKKLFLQGESPTLRTVLSFFSFKVLTHTYLVKTSTTDDKYLPFLFFEGNDPISVKTAA